MNAITVKNLTKTYGEHVAVDNLSFTVSKGSVFALLGANGAGKARALSAFWEQRKWTLAKFLFSAKIP